jgi:hypothetical protein
MFSVGCGVGEPGTALGTVERVSFTGRSAFGKKNCVSRGIEVVGGVGSGLNTTPQRSKPSGHRNESNSQTDAHRAREKQGENGRDGEVVGNKKGEEMKC